MSVMTTSNIPEGPGRWERARRHAEAWPNSKAAKLYLRRTDNAAQLEREYPMDRTYLVTRVAFNGGSGRRIYLCRTYCAALQVQLENKLTDPTSLRDWFAHVRAGEVAVVFRSRWTLDASTTLEYLDVSQLRRPVSCRVCGNTITNDKLETKAIVSVSSTQPAAEPKHRWYVTPDGKMYAAAELRVLELTDEVSVLLQNYSTDELRRQCAVDLGYPMSEAT